MRHARRQQLAQDVARKRHDKTQRSRALIGGLAALCFAGLLVFGAFQLLVHPSTPLPREWNPTQNLVLTDPVTPITKWKLNRAAGHFDQCIAALSDDAAVERRAPLSVSEQCFINDRVVLRSVGKATVDPLETRCAIALRLAMWERHSLQPAAAEFLGSQVTGIRQIGSYNCRAIRTGSGASSRMSTHATADAIDIAGFDLADGTQISVLNDWTDSGRKSAFLNVVRDGACDWFDLTLSPDYNRLHADHFHLQSRGWGLCR